MPRFTDFDKLLAEYQDVTSEPIPVGTRVWCRQLKNFAKIIEVKEFHLGPPNYVVEVDRDLGERRFVTTFLGADLMVPK